MDYQKLMSLNPFKYGESITNSLGQLIEFYEHPLEGGDAPVVVVCHELKLAAVSDFYETDDMVEEHGEYSPHFIEKNGKYHLVCKYEL